MKVKVKLNFQKNNRKNKLKKEVKVLIKKEELNLFNLKKHSMKNFKCYKIIIRMILLKFKSNKKRKGIKNPATINLGKLKNWVKN